MQVSDRRYYDYVEVSSKVEVKQLDSVSKAVMAAQNRCQDNFWGSGGKDVTPKARCLSDEECSYQTDWAKDALVRDQILKSPISLEGRVEKYLGPK